MWQKKIINNIIWCDMEYALRFLCWSPKQACLLMLARLHIHPLARSPTSIVDLVCVLVSTISIIYNDGNIALISCNKDEYPKIQCSWAYYRSIVTCIVVVYISHGIHNMFFKECQLLICNCWHCNDLCYVFVVSHVACYKFCGLIAIVTFEPLITLYFM
jgi:hypothetical protein